MDYRSFLESKLLVEQPSGFEVADAEINRRLFPFQRDIVRWGVRKGRAAVFTSTGTGKTLMQIECARLVAEHTGGRVLILVPLGVVQQTIAEGRSLGVAITYARHQSQAPDRGVTICNYDMVAHLDPGSFDGVVLDESSCLKHEDAKIGTRLIEASRSVPFRFAYTATPAPNDHAELARHADFLGVMERREVLATFFVHANKADGSKGQEWRLKGHARQPFYQWLASWAMSLKRPSDLGYSDDGYALPDLSIRPVIVATDWKRPGELFASELKGIQDRAAVRRETLADRVRATVELVQREPGEPWVLWCGLNAEQDALAAALGDVCVSIDGRTDPDSRLKLYRQWRSGERRILITKGAVFGYGMNWQHCARLAFVGLSDSFELYHQIIRRFWRFLQTRAVHAYIVLTEPEEVIFANVLRKEREFEQMTDELVRCVADFERAELAGVGHTEDLPHAQPTQIPAWLQGAA